MQKKSNKMNRAERLRRYYRNRRKSTTIHVPDARTVEIFGKTIYIPGKFAIDAIEMGE